MILSFELSRCKQKRTFVLVDNELRFISGSAGLFSPLPKFPDSENSRISFPGMREEHM